MLAALRHYLKNKPGAEETQPFGPDALVYKVMGKMFAIVAWQADPLTITLKCDPDEAEMLRSLYLAVKPGYHTNKRHWNTITLHEHVVEDTLPDGMIFSLIDNSYQLVVKNLNKKTQSRLAILTAQCDK